MNSITTTAYQKSIEQELRRHIPESGLLQERVIHAMEYGLLSGGKRVRGTLLLAFYQLFSGQSDYYSVLPFAAAVEMVHGYSLIHDDLPCMDDDAVRRGKPACHIAFGESTALLAGDALLTLAFEVMTDTVEDVFSSDQILKAVNLLSKASGYAGMIGGQVLDLENESRVIDGKRMEDTDLMKTGALIASACEIGALLGGANPEERQQVRQYALQLGLAFQIVDDILDATSTEEVLGKPIASDQENMKNTYVSVYGVYGASKMAQDVTDYAMKQLEQLGGENAYLLEYTKGLMGRAY